MKGEGWGGVVARSLLSICKDPFLPGIKRKWGLGRGVEKILSLLTGLCLL